MRRIRHRRVVALGACLALLVMFGAGGKTSAKKREVPLKAEETVSDLAILRYNDTIRFEGVGLVVGLDNTGSEAEPSYYRTKLLEIMRKARVEHAERYLASSRASLVIVHGTVPVGVSTKDRFDVELEVTPASATTSLEGGFLMETELRIVVHSEDKMLEGQPIGTAFGPVVVGQVTKGKAAKPGAPDNPRAGRVLGGARVRKDVPYTLVLKEDRKSGRTSKRVQDAINLRFHQNKGIDQRGMAEAKTDQVITLHVPRVYRDNQARFFQVIEHLPVMDNPDLRAARQQRWGKELLDPSTSGLAALRLEGIGRNATKLLQGGLASPNFQVRFFAAEALAYLNDHSGVEVLEHAVTTQPKFRTHALAALAAMDQPASILCLQRLMVQADPKIRYGAFNALRTISEDEPFLGRVRVLHDDREAAEQENALALLINAPTQRRKPRSDDPFALYVVDCEGPPMIHVARTRR
jgi:flagellar basal body P-ring protein FlgI